MFVDRVTVTFKAGDGGNGHLSFRHEKFKAMGGPDGGDGGDGGSIILRASNNQNTLADFRYKKLIGAENGQPGSMRRRHGKTGENLVLSVPIGTVVMQGDLLLADLAQDGQEFMLAQGGQGGFGNAHFVSSTRQAPRIAEKGEKGEELEVTLEMKMIADVGIVGLPNAGKSTLLSVISNAKPEIANYPFTTLRPNLGVVDIDKNDSLLFADIPGLIEGASQGKGLGDEFLRHVERTAVLVHLVDVYNDDIAAAYKTIIKELAAYKVDLSKRPQVVALSKIEGLDKKQLDKARKSLQKIVPAGTVVTEISTVSKEGVEDLMRVLQKMVAKNRQKQAKKGIKPVMPIIGLKQDDDSWAIQRDGKKFVITGKKIERFAKRTDFDSFHGQQRLRDIMRKMGIMRELERQNIDPGQTIQIGQPSAGKLEY